MNAVGSTLLAALSLLLFAMPLPSTSFGTLKVAYRAALRPRRSCGRFPPPPRFDFDGGVAGSTMHPRRRPLAPGPPHASASPSSSKAGPDAIPRAAVSVVVRWRRRDDEGPPLASADSPLWLLVQRGNEPNRGMWSFPGGRIEPGEGTLDAAKRELAEETGLEVARRNPGEDLIAGETPSDYELRWHPNGPFACSDVIGRGYHYVIGQCFAEAVAPSKPLVSASDDAMDARWWSVEEVREAERGEGEGGVTRGVLRVLERSERLYAKGLLECE
ncbi:hypothetical protein ACHAWF_009275 [Thalassiosira exigua]